MKVYRGVCLAVMDEKEGKRERRRRASRAVARLFTAAGERKVGETERSEMIEQQYPRLRAF